MTKQEIKQKVLTDWKVLNQLVKSYLDIQKTRVAMELRCQKLEEQELFTKRISKRRIFL